MEKTLPEYFPPSPRGSEQEVKEEIEEQDIKCSKTSLLQQQDDGNICLIWPVASLSNQYVYINIFVIMNFGHY